mgnify:CR=1 FL=1
MSLTIKFKTIQPYLTFEAVVEKLSVSENFNSVCLKRSLIEACFTVYIIFGLVISDLFYLDFTWLHFEHSFMRPKAVIVIIISDLLERRGVYLILSLNLPLIPHYATRCYAA